VPCEQVYCRDARSMSCWQKFASFPSNFITQPFQYFQIVNLVDCLYSRYKFIMNNPSNIKFANFIVTPPFLSHHSRFTQIRSSPTVIHKNNSWTSFIGYFAGPLKSYWHYAVFRTHFLRSVIANSYPVHHNYSSCTIIFPKWIIYVSCECSYLNDLCYLSVPLGKFMVFSLFHKCRQDCVRNLDVCINMISIPDLEVRCQICHESRLVSATHINLQVSYFREHSVLVRVTSSYTGYIYH
jgi:hypothetical protein